jgi:cytidyltransferase-like protein
MVYLIFVHLGHIKHFKKARTYGDYLIVSITKDEFIKKGPGRPIFQSKSKI